MRQALQETMRKGADLIPRCAAALRAVLGKGGLDFRGAGGDGGEATLHGSWGAKTVVVVIEARVSTAAVGPLMARIKRTGGGSPPLLMSAYIPPDAARALRDGRINYVDGAGNIYLNLPPLLVWHQGFRREAPAHRPARLFQAAGLKILSVVLWEPGAVNGSYRDLAQRAGVSLGAIAAVFGDLAQGGFLRGTKGGRQLTRQRELLEQWALGYAGQLFPRLILQTCRLAEGGSVEDFASRLRGHRFRGEVLAGGEWAAGMATGYLRPARAALHIPPGGVAKWMGALRLIPDPEGNVDVIERFAEGNQWIDPPAAFHGLACANPILLYGELLRQGTDERLRETAELLFEKFIAPIFGESR